MEANSSHYTECGIFFYSPVTLVSITSIFQALWTLRLEHSLVKKQLRALLEVVL